MNEIETKAAADALLLDMNYLTPEGYGAIKKAALFGVMVALNRLKPTVARGSVVDLNPMTNFESSYR